MSKRKAGKGKRFLEYFVCLSPVLLCLILELDVSFPKLFVCNLQILIVKHKPSYKDTAQMTPFKFISKTWIF